MDVMDALLLSPIQRQQVLVLYLRNSALDSGVVGWARYDGTGRETHMAGDDEFDADYWATRVENDP